MTTAGLRARLARVLRRFGIGQSRSGRSSTAFTSAFVALAAKMAKADGVAVDAEWEAFESFLEVPADEKANVRRVYDLAKQDTGGADVHARNISALLGDDAQLRRDVLECLLCIACSDGVLHPAEDEFLASVAVTLGFSMAEFRSIRALFVRDADSPYDVLGLAPDATDGEVKARYRTAAAETHPDRLTAAAAPAAVIKAANAKLAAINAAHDAILAERRGGRRS